MIKTAIIGLGWWGSIILKALLNSPVVNPVLGVDPSEAARAAASALGVKTAARFEDALADPEIKAVILCTPQEHHAKQIVAAAQSERHVFLRKTVVHDRGGCGSSHRCGEKSGCAAWHRTRATFRARGDRNAAAICGR